MRTIRLPLAPVPASRPRVTRTGVSFYAKPYGPWKKEAAKKLTALASSTPALTGLLSVAIRIFASRPKTTKLEVPRPDVDNYAKAVLDAGNGSLWADDRQITDLRVTKEWAPPGVEGHIEIDIDVPAGRLRWKD